MGVIQNFMTSRHTKILKNDFFGSSRPRTETKIAPFDSPWKLHHIDTFLGLNNQLQNLTSLDLTLTWPRPEIHPEVVHITYWVCLLNSMSKMTHKTCVAHALFYILFLVTWPDLTWPWPWPLNDIVCNEYCLGSLRTRFGQSVSVHSSATTVQGRYCRNLHFVPLTWPWPDLWPT